MPAFSLPANVRVFQCEWFGADAGTNANVTKTTAAIQEALTSCYDNGGGTVTLTEPGTYYISGTTSPILTMYSNTEFVLGAGVTLCQLASNGGKTMIRGANYAAAQVTASGNISTTSTSTGNLIASVSAAGLGVSEGDWIWIVGDTSGGVGGVYNGLHQVASYAGPTLTFLMKASTTLSASSGTILICKADGNITISGPGVIDYNMMNGNSSGTGNDKHAILFNKCGRINIRDIEIRNADKYAVYMNNYDGFRGERITFRTGSDGLHFNGPGYNTYVNSLQGETGDDMCAFTTTNGAFTQYNVPNGDGSFFGIEINNLQEQQATNHRCVLIEANGGYGYYGVKIDGIQCLHTGYIAVMLTCQDTYSGFVADCDIKNVSGGYGLAAVGPVLVAGPTTSGLLTVGTVSVNGVYPSSPNSGEALVYSSGRITGKQFKIANVVQRPLSLKSAIKVTGANVTWDQIIVEKSRGDFDAANAAVNLQLGQFESGTFKHILMRDCYATTSGTNTQPCQLITLFAPAAVTRVDIENCYHDGYTSAFLPNSITNVPTVRLSGTKHAGLFVISTSNSYNLDVNDIEIISCSGGTAFNNGATSKTFGIFARGIRNTGAVTLFGYGTTNTFNLTGSDGTVTLKTDTAGHTFNISTGCILNDTQTATPGIYGKGPTAYTRLVA